MNRRSLLKAGLTALGVGAGSAGADPRQPRLLFVLGGTDTPHEFGRNAQLWISSLNAGLYGAPNPQAIVRAEQFEDLRYLARLTDPAVQRYDAVIVYARWDPSHGGTLTEPQRRGLREYVAGGGALVVVHNGAAAFSDWPEYRRIVGGAFVAGQSKHTAVKPFLVHLEDRSHKITRGYRDFRITDELYQGLQLAPNANVKVLATATEAGVKEPVAWVNTYRDGRVFYTALGHDPEAWGNEGFQRLLTNGLNWAMRNL